MGLALVENLAALGAGAVSPVQGPPRLGRADGKISSDRPSFGCALFRAVRRSAREARGEARFGADEREHSLFAWTKGLSGDAREGDTESVSVRASGVRASGDGECRKYLATSAFPANRSIRDSFRHLGFVPLFGVHLMNGIVARATATLALSL
jgi:hypothetical protein